MTKRILGVLAISLIAMTAAPTAGAAPFTPRLELAYRIAVDYWGQEPTLCTSIDREIVSRGSLLSAEPWGEATVPSEPMSCILYVSRFLASPYESRRLCQVMIHEVGHLLGLGHSDDPASPMYPYPVTTEPLCIRAGNRGYKLMQARERAHHHRTLRAIRALRREQLRFWGLA